MKTCSNCGHELNDEMDFCPNCGNQVNSEIEYSFLDEDEKPWYETDIFNIAIAPIVRSFDNGKFFLTTAKVIIDIIVSTFLFSQPYQAYLIYKNHGLRLLSSSDKAIELIFAIFMLIIAVFSFGYWMKRIRRLNTIFNSNDDFVVIPLGTYLLQWVGEWLALMLSICGIFAIIVSLDHVNTTSLALSLISYYGWDGGVMAIVASILIVFSFRLIAEKLRALAAIANNTSKKQSVFTNDKDDSDTNDLYFNILYAICILLTVGFMIAAMFSK